MLIMFFFSQQTTTFNTGAGSGLPICDQSTIFDNETGRPFCTANQILSFLLTLESLRKISLIYRGDHMAQELQK